MGESAHTLTDRRRSPMHIHVGAVTVYRRVASWNIYYREGGKANFVDSFKSG